MRIHKLSLTNYRNLQDFDISFDEEPFITVIMGRNGTGKSYFLEAVIEIFRELDRDPFKPPFGYFIEYEVNNNRIEIIADPTRDVERIEFIVNGEDLSLENFNKNKKAYLPKYVFGYYSGFNDRLQHHFEAHLNDYRDDLQNGERIPLRRLFYAVPGHSQFVLLAFFLSEEDEDIYKFLQEQLRIESLHSALFVVKKPQKGRTFNPLKSFWGVQGILNEFLIKLYELALAPIHVPRIDPDRVYLYIKDVNRLRQLAREYLGQLNSDSDRDFFQAIEGLYISGLVESVRIFVNLEDHGGVVAFRELSEGEQQLLTVLGLLRFTQDEESLFLLDEPDTHLNPKWSFDYLEFLQKYGGASSDSTSQMILASHSPLVISELTKEQIRILERNETTGALVSKRPVLNPRGMGIDGILTSEIFGFRSTLDKHTLELLDQKRELATIPPSERTQEHKQALSEINRKLDELRFTRTSDDPLYELFTEVMTSLEDQFGLQKTTLSSDEMRLRENLAAYVLEQILDELQESE